jgi:hypothetical protein
MIPVLIEAALRALLVALTVWAGLRLFRVSNVPAQKTAWGLVLVCAVAMPLVMRWEPLPASFTMRLPASIWRTSAEAVPMRDAARAVVPDESAPVAVQTKFAAPPKVNAAKHLPEATGAKLDLDSPVQDSTGVAPGFRDQLEEKPFFSKVGGWAADLRAELSLVQLETLAAILYFAICALLLVRLFYGLNLAMKLWQSAEVFVPYPEDDPGYGLRMRFSRAVSSPVTIGSGVLLPYECLEWDAEKLRIVLAHERAHVRQGDFYLQLLAGVYSAIFWFSPLGWWLKGKLCDLGEAMSDHAGLEEAASHATYAQLLLEFAALPRPTQMNLTRIGVAMANRRNLSYRIERLLNESSFRQAFAGTRRRVLLALALVPVALFAGTALIRVEAASSGQAALPQAAPAAPAAAPNPAPAPATAPEPIGDLALPSPEAPAPLSVSVPDSAPAVAPIPPIPPRHLEIHVSADAHAIALISAQDNVNVNTQTNVSADTVAVAQQGTSVGKGYSYSYSSNGDTWALVTDPSDKVTFSGDWHDSTRESINKVRKLTGGRFLWFKHGDKTYFIDDASVIGQIVAMYKPMEELGRKQEELGKKQEELGKQQEEMGNKQEQASIPTPDISKEMAKLNEAVAKLDAKKGSTVSQEELAGLEERLADIQGRLGELEGQVGERQGQLGEMQGKLGEQQGKLGEEQGRLGEMEGKLSEEADRKIKSIIDQSLQNGKAKPVQ